MSEPDDNSDKISLVAETARVAKRMVETGRTTIQTTVTERDEVVQAWLERNDVAVERVPVGRIVAEAPAARQEGDTWVFPVLEERLVVEKKLFLKEEVRVRGIATREKFEQTVRLREEQADIKTEPPHEP